MGKLKQGDEKKGMRGRGLATNINLVRGSPPKQSNSVGSRSKTVAVDGPAADDKPRRGRVPVPQLRSGGGGVKKVKVKVNRGKKKGKGRGRKRTGGPPGSGGVTKSKIWGFFTPCSPHPNDGTPRSRCNLCSRILKVCASTSPLFVHLRRSHPEEAKQLGSGLAVPAPPPSPHPEAVGAVEEAQPEGDEAGMEDPPPPILFPFDHGDDSDSGTESMAARPQPGLTAGVPVPACSQSEEEKLLKTTVNVMVSNMLPLYRVNDEEYKDVICGTDPRYQHLFAPETTPNLLTSVTQTMETRYEELKQSVRQQLLNKYISLGVEVCIMKRTESFAMVTAHFVGDDWTLRERYLGMRPLQIDLNGREPSQIQISTAVSNVVGALLDEFGIDAGKVTRVVHNSLPFQATSVDAAPAVWPCINEAVRRCQVNLNGYIRDVTGQDVLQACHNFGQKYFLSGDYKAMKNQPLRLLAEVKQAILDSGGSDPESQLVGDITAYNILHHPIADLIEILLGREGMSASLSLLLPALFGMRSCYDSPQQDLGDANITPEDKKRMGRAIMDSIGGCYQVNLDSTDFGNPSLSICTFLDPRYKLLQNYTEGQRQSVLAAVTGLLRQVFAPPPPASNKLFAFISMAGSPSSSDSKIQEELAKYMAEPVVPYKYDVFQWWQKNQSRFPFISVIATKYLCMAVEATPAKSIFTREGAKERKTALVSLELVEPEYRDKMLFLKRNEKF